MFEVKSSYHSPHASSLKIICTIRQSIYTMKTLNECNKKLSSDECKHSRFRIRYVTFLYSSSMLKNIDHKYFAFANLV